MSQKNLFEYDIDNDGVIREAEISECGIYRYRISRIWNMDAPHVLFVLLNPSTADAIVDDPTLGRCMSFAREWGYGGLIIVNLFAARSANPKMLKEVKDPVGPENDKWIKEEAEKASLIVLGWGNHGSLRNRDKKVLPWLKEARCLAVTKQGQPSHPLYLSKTLKPFLYKTKKNVDKPNKQSRKPRHRVKRR